MGMRSLHPVAPCGFWKSTGRPTPTELNPVFLSHSAHLRHSLTSTSSAPQGSSTKSRGRVPVSMSLQMEEAATVKQSPPEAESDTVPSVVDITIPPESLAGFEADYERVSATWPADLATTVDDAKIEQFVSSAHAMARRWLPHELVSRLESFMYDLNAPAALVIRGLPIDRELPPTEPNCHLKKTGKCVSETWLVGIGRIVGQVFILDFLRGSRTGMGLLVREIYSTVDTADQASAQGSRVLLDMHVDFFVFGPERFPNVIGFIGVRGDRNKEGKTLLTDHRKLYRMLDPADIQVLRSEKITWAFSSGGFSAYVIEGSESNPRITVFEENVHNVGGFKVVQGSPEAVAAYKRVKEIAATLVEGVWLGSGDVLLVNQKKASHGRTPYAAKFDGNDRWLQRLYINGGGFWDAGIVQWPSRTLPGSPATDKKL